MNLERYIGSQNVIIFRPSNQCYQVWLAKLLSGHSASLSLSVGRSSTSEPRPIPARAPFLRRVWLRFVRVLHALAPLLQLLQGALLLAATWVAAAYFTVCFGAPLLSYWQETASFCLLVVLLTAYPCLLVLGPTPSSLHSLYTSGSTDTTPLPATLYLNSVCSLAGAWLGAVPLPLDWDRPWQVNSRYKSVIPIPIIRPGQLPVAWAQLLVTLLATCSALAGYFVIALDTRFNLYFIR